MTGNKKPAGASLFAGVISLLLTPFNQDRSIDWSLYDTYVDWQLQHRPNGLFAVCGTSEMKWLTLRERLELARRAVARAGETPVLATANLDPDWSKHADELRRIEETGVAAVVLVPPDGLGRDPAALEAHFAQLARVASLPVFVYEWPQVSYYHLSHESFGRLVDDYGVMGIKDTTCTVTGITQKIQAAPDAIVYQANTPYLPEAIAAGARGTMAITSSAAADLVVAYWQAAQRAPHSDFARALHAQLVFLDAILRIAHPVLAKELLRQRGLPFPATSRWPVEASAEVRQALTTWYNGFTRLIDEGALGNARGA